LWNMIDSDRRERLESWKEIAVYLRRGVSTVQRWEQQEGLPVHRLPHAKKGSIFANKCELEAWWRARAHLEPLHQDAVVPSGPRPRRGTLHQARARIAAPTADGRRRRALLVWLHQVVPGGRPHRVSHEGRWGQQEHLGHLARRRAAETPDVRVGNRPRMDARRAGARLRGPELPRRAVLDLLYPAARRSATPLDGPAARHLRRHLLRLV